MANELTSINQNIKDLVQGMRGYVQKLGATIGSHVSDVMSEEMKMTTDTIKSGFTFAKNASVKTLAFFGKSFGIDWKSLKVQIGQLKMLQLLNGQMKREEKTRLGRMKGRAKDLLAALFELLGIPLMIIGAAAGAILGKFLLPFTLIAKIIKRLLPIGKALSALAKTGPIAKLLSSFSWLGKIFIFFGKLWGIRHILKGLKFGFTKLIWPLQIIMSVIDFVTGFMSTEGTLFDKIKGGIKNVIMKFIEWPAIMLGKLWDWVTIDLLKIRKEDQRGKAGESIIKAIGESIDSFWNFLDLVFKPIKDSFVWLLDVIKKADFKAALEWINNLKDNINEFPKRLWEWIKNLPGISLINDLFKDKPEKNKGGGQVIRGNIDNELSKKVDDIYKQKSQIAGLTPQLKIQEKQLEATEKSNQLLKKISEKETTDTVIVPPQAAKQTMEIPASTGIENMTAKDLGLEHGVF